MTLFGGILSAYFCGIFDTRRNHFRFMCSMALILLFQGAAYSFLDAGLLRQIYPFITHLPLLLVLRVLMGKWLWPSFAILSSYLCCQLRRWIALLAVAVFFRGGGPVMQEVVELVITAPLLLLLVRFAGPGIRQLSGYPLKTQCLFSLIPALYYGFDYLTRIYTDLLTSGNPVAVEFMPFVCGGAYLIFLLYYCVEEERQRELLQIQRSLDIQLNQSVREIRALRESQALASGYRHDMRHHLQHLSTCIGNGQLKMALTYISGICEEIEAQKVQRYCENEAANLILSSFAGRAGKDGVDMRIQGALPEIITVSDSDLCVLLSNALENALHACRDVAALGRTAVIDVKFYERDYRLFLQVKNSCQAGVRFQKGIPVSDRENHGIGVQSICAIVERYGGIYAFDFKDGWFLLRVSL